MTKECLWYNGISSAYELLDFDPNGLTNYEIIQKVKEVFISNNCYDEETFDKVLETVYLIDIDNLEGIK